MYVGNGATSSSVLLEVGFRLLLLQILGKLAQEFKGIYVVAVCDTARREKVDLK